MSTFVSVKPWISIYCIRISFNCSKLLGSEFMLSFSVQILFPILLPRFLNTNDRFKEISLMDLSLAWFAKFNISFLLKRSPEDMLKFIVEQWVSGKLLLERRYFSTTMLSMDVNELNGLKDVDALNQCYCLD